MNTVLAGRGNVPSDSGYCCVPILESVSADTKLGGSTDGQFEIYINTLGCVRMTI